MKFFFTFEDGKKINVDYATKSDLIYAIDKGVSLYSINLDNEQEKEKELKGKLININRISIKFKRKLVTQIVKK